MKSKARSIALASAVKIDESSGIRCFYVHHCLVCESCESWAKLRECAGLYEFSLLVYRP